MENLPTRYSQAVAGNQTRDLVVIKLVFFRFLINGSAIQIRPWAPTFPSHLHHFTVISQIDK